MTRSRWGCWTALALLVGCNGKIELPGATAGGAGGKEPTADGAGGKEPTAGAGAQGGASGSGAGGKSHGTAGLQNAGAAGDDERGGGGAGGTESGGTGGLDSWGTAGIATGGAGGTLEPGQLGAECLPGSTANDGNGVTNTSIVTLTRCAADLVCGSQGKCVSMPNCPQASGPCVVRRPVLEGPMPSSGAGGADGGFAGYGNIPVVRARVGVQDMASDGAHLYWAEYGSRDALGNYKNNGALLSYSFADGALSSLSSNAVGPRQLAVTTQYVYLRTDGAALIGNPEDNRIWRFPLSGGAATEFGAFPDGGLFASHGERAFFNDGRNWYVANTTGWTVFPDSSPAYFAAADDTTLFYNWASLQSLPVAGGTATALASQLFPFALGDALIYGLEQVDAGVLINKLPKTGGTWTRILALGSGSPQSIAVVGDRYFVSVQRYLDFVGREDSILTGPLDGSASPVRIVQQVRTGSPPGLLFEATATALYWSDGRGVYRRALSEATAP